MHGRGIDAAEHAVDVAARNEAGGPLSVAVAAVGLTPRQRQMSAAAAGRVWREGVRRRARSCPPHGHVHVKAIYRQFGVMPRAELMAKFVQK